jgi:hypothetical protein
MNDEEVRAHRSRLLAVLEARRKRSRRGCNRPPPVVGWELVRAGFPTLRALARAVPVSHEVLSRIRADDSALSARLRRRLAELLDVPEDRVLLALRRDPGPRWRW